MRHYDVHDEVDFVVVGAGAGGAVFTQRLARAGCSVVCLDAGPFWDPDADWVSDELGSHVLYWTDPRQIGGTDPVPLGSNNSGRGVGGSMVHYAGYTPRFHPSDFHTLTTDGVGADWPIDYPTLKPYYELIEAELPVAGQDWPWGDPHATPTPPIRSAATGRSSNAAPTRQGWPPASDQSPSPTAGSETDRTASTVGSACKAARSTPRPARSSPTSPTPSHTAPRSGPTATSAGSSSTTTRDAPPASNTSMTGSTHRQRARAVAVACYSIETPRLLLLSTSKRFPDGLGNDDDQVGRYLMVQGAPQTAGRFAEEVRMYKAPPPEVSSEQFYETQPGKPYKRGWSIQTVSPLPITWAEHVAAQGHWGEPLREYMRDYNHWACLGALCELLPQPDNRVTLADEKDRHGLPVAHFSYSKCENDRQLVTAARTSMEEILRAAGAEEVMTIERYAHLVGGARMAAGADRGVVDSDHRVFGTRNVFIVDGSTLPTQGAANPALTIMSLAARAAARITSGAVTI